MRNCLIVVKYQNGLVKLRQTLIDQGLVYQNERYITSLKEHGIVQSMNRKGNCIDNCVMETFFGRMKTKMFNGHEKEYQTFEVFSEAVDDYIYFYNNQRIQKKQNGCLLRYSGVHPSLILWYSLFNQYVQDSGYISNNVFMFFVFT